MIYLYDKAIVDDLNRSFNPDVAGKPVVKVIDPEAVIGIAAQIQEDAISFPIVALTRADDPQIDTNRTNFTLMHEGIQAAFDPVSNDVYYERVIPITLSYSLTLLTTNTADMDELVREILFKYISMYFLTIDLPYEVNRKVRFGVVVDTNTSMDRSSSSGEYLATGQLYQTIIPLECHGAVLVHYTPAHLRRSDYELKIMNPTGKLVTTNLLYK